MNEYRLTWPRRRRRSFLIKQMDDYFFGEARRAPEFRPAEAK